MGLRKVDKDKALGIAFYYAARDGNSHLVDVLLDADVDIHFGADIALRGAAEFGQAEIVERLLQHGADPHSKDGQALKLAKKNRHRKTAAVLQRWMNFKAG